MRNRMLECSILNGYDGLDELIELAERNPAEAESIAWEVLLSRGDPGKDDYGLCSELFLILAATASKKVIADRVAIAWPQLDHEVRLNLLASIDTGVLDTKSVSDLFHTKGNCTAIRHRIAAALAASRFDEAKDVVRNLVSEIGEYESTEKQEILDRFKESVMNTE